MKKPAPKELYRHYKGGLYIVEEIAIHSEDLSEMVIYRSMNAGGKLFARPLSMWFNEIPGIAKERFTKVSL